MLAALEPDVPTPTYALDFIRGQSERLVRLADDEPPAPPMLIAGAVAGGSTLPLSSEHPRRTDRRGKLAAAHDASGADRPAQGRPRHRAGKRGDATCYTIKVAG